MESLLSVEVRMVRMLIPVGSAIARIFPSEELLISRNRSVYSSEIPSALNVIFPGETVIPAEVSKGVGFSERVGEGRGGVGVITLLLPDSDMGVEQPASNTARTAVSMRKMQNIRSLFIQLCLPVLKSIYISFPVMPTAERPVITRTKRRDLL
jgi:hypothetical protein